MFLFIDHWSYSISLAPELQTWDSRCSSHTLGLFSDLKELTSPFIVLHLDPVIKPEVRICLQIPTPPLACSAWSWTSYFTSLALRFFIYKIVRMIISTSQDFVSIKFTEEIQHCLATDSFPIRPRFHFVPLQNISSQKLCPLSPVSGPCARGLCHFHPYRD